MDHALPNNHVCIVEHRSSVTLTVSSCVAMCVGIPASGETFAWHGGPTLQQPVFRSRAPVVVAHLSGFVEFQTVLASIDECLNECGLADESALRVALFGGTVHAFDDWSEFETLSAMLEDTRRRLVAGTPIGEELTPEAMQQLQLFATPTSAWVCQELRKRYPVHFVFPECWDICRVPGAGYRIGAGCWCLPSRSLLFESIPEQDDKLKFIQQAGRQQITVSARDGSVTRVCASTGVGILPVSDAAKARLVEANHNVAQQAAQQVMQSDDDDSERYQPPMQRGLVRMTVS